MSILLVVGAPCSASGARYTGVPARLFSEPLLGSLSMTRARPKSHSFTTPLWSICTSSRHFQLPSKCTWYKYWKWSESEIHCSIQIWRSTFFRKCYILYGQITKITLKLLVTNRTKIMCKSEEMLGKINAQADKVTYAEDRNGQR
jgi:hypothetical protein